MEKFLYELVNIDNGTVHTTMLMTERNAEEGNKWLIIQKKRLEWRKKLPPVIDDMTKERQA